MVRGRLVRRYKRFLADVLWGATTPTARGTGPEQPAAPISDPAPSPAMSVSAMSPAVAAGQLPLTAGLGPSPATSRAEPAAAARPRRSGRAPSAATPPGPPATAAASGAAGPARAEATAAQPSGPETSAGAPVNADGSTTCHCANTGPMTRMLDWYGGKSSLLPCWTPLVYPGAPDVTSGHGQARQARPSAATPHHSSSVDRTPGHWRRVRSACPQRPSASTGTR